MSKRPAEKQEGGAKKKGGDGGGGSAVVVEPAAAAKTALPPSVADFDYTKVASRYRKRVKQFLETGICEYSPALSKPQVKACRREVYSMFDRTMQTIKRLGKEEDLMKVGFTNFKLRHTGRFDMQIDDFSGDSFKFLREGAPWLPMVNAILGDDCVLGNTGVMLSLPGSGTQPWHSDGDHVVKKEHALPHCLNVFVPLVSITKANGGTEMVPETHFIDTYDLDNESVTIQAKSGSCILFDFRLKHRGLGNNSLKPRPLMYLTYVIPSFRDTMNFRPGRYLKLPTLDPLMTREDRAAARGADSAFMVDESVKKKIEQKLGSDLKYSSGGMMDYVDSDSEDEEDVAPKPKISLEQKTREARAKHRKLAAGCPRINGVGIYVGGPVIARDLKHGWFPSKIVSINPEKRTIKVHFNGWHKRFDFSAPFDSDRFKPASVELLASGKSTVMEGM